MSAVTNGAELLKRLREAKTPSQRLKPGRDELLRIKADRNEVANSAQIVAALEGAFGPDHMTVVKAKAIARDGVWVPPVAVAVAVAVEDDFLADALTPVSAAPPGEAPKKGRVRKAVESKKVQGVEAAGA